MIPRRWEKEIFHSYYGTRGVFSTSSCYYWLLRLEENISFFFIHYCYILSPIIIFTYFSCRRKVYRQRIVTPFVNSSFYTCIYWHIFFAVAFSRTFFKKKFQKIRHTGKIFTSALCSCRNNVCIRSGTCSSLQAFACFKGAAGRTAYGNFIRI